MEFPSTGMTKVVGESGRRAEYPSGEGDWNRVKREGKVVQRSRVGAELGAQGRNQGWPHLGRGLTEKPS